MHCPDLFMTPTAQAMVPATAIRVRRLAAALRALLLLDRDRARRSIADRRFPPGASGPAVTRWDRPIAALHAGWLETHFGDVPDDFIRWAVETVSADLHPGPERQARLAALAGTITLRQFLIQSSWPSVRIRFGFSAVASDVAELVRDHSGVLRIRLFDDASGCWVWHLAAYTSAAGRRPRIVDRLMPDGERMVAVPGRCAEFRVASSGLSFTWHDPDPLDVEPVIAILPFQDLTIPESFFRG